MKNLKNEKCWCIFESGKGFIGVNGEPAAADNLTTFTEAANYMSLLHNRGGSPWPPAFSIGLSLDAAECITIDLMNAWDSQRNAPVDGAAAWMSACHTYAEMCHAGSDGRAIRIIGRGEVPKNVQHIPRVCITTAGHVTLTTHRIASRPSWQCADDGGIIRDCTAALEQFLVPRKPEYITL